LNRSETSKDAYLLDVTDNRSDVKSFQFGVDGVKTSNKMLQKQLERLRQAD